MGKLFFLGKTAIVTGASSGIGRSTALALARQGACVALASRNGQALKEVAGEIRSMGRQALIVPVDVTREQQVKHLVEETLGHWGRIDILVANAGQYIRTPVTKLRVSHLEHSMAVNFYGSVYAVLAVLPHMLSQKSGHIVLVNTVNAKKGLPPDTPYVAAKFALSGFGEVLRQEIIQEGIYVTSVYPGRVDTPMIKNLKVPWVSAKIPAEAVAEAILHAIRHRQAEVIIPRRARLLYILNVISPRLADRVVRFLHLQGWQT